MISPEAHYPKRFKSEKQKYNMTKESSIEFVKDFFGISFDEREEKSFLDFSRFIKLKKQGLSNPEAAKGAGVFKSTAIKWLYNYSTPFAVRLWKHYQKLGKPKEGYKWLSINSTRGGLFTGPWISVPVEISNFEQIRMVLKQLTELESFHVRNKKFNLELNNENKTLLFAYLLGMMIGDASKHPIKRKNRITRRIQIRLTTAHKSNERIGGYSSMCTNSLSLRMDRTKNCPKGKMNTHPFYAWHSQCSPLIQWMFTVCLGLKTHERTTYDKISAKWLLQAPREFKISFLQGLADSDGFVDFTAQTAVVISHPNTDLIEEIFSSLGIRTRRWLITVTGLWCLIISIKDAYKLPLFNPYIKCYRYEKVIKLFNAKRISGHWPTWLALKVEEYLRQEVSGTKLVERIIDEYGIAIRTRGILRRKRKMKEKEGLTCLGIESTAL